ncbi:MAG: T9SS C-terminal target domain-containing protein [Flavobacteriales bacterium]|nr:T9SS C-terminal target domain-containing protein [Flavobacteriales bacterium]
MKKLFLIVFASASVAYGQSTVSISSEDYQQLKLSGTIDPNVTYVFTDVAFPTNIKYNGGLQKNDLCDCMVPLDSSFTLAMLPNDDNSSPLISLPFTFDFYGNTYNSVFINNNGNVSFQAPYITWSANSFPDSTYNMIAPFWADVDTRGGYDSLGNSLGNGGSVWYKVTPTALIVNWDNVGYFNMHNDLVSSFQLIITNGSDSLVSAGGNVSFCYQDMQWTTGDASGGFGGFGGIPATVGVNIGNGIDYFQVGRFDQAGTSFDGPFNGNDGVDFLDGQEIYFNVAGISTSNTPPLLISSAICDTIDVFTGDTLKSLNTTGFNIGIMTPENGQTIEITGNSDAPAGAFSYSVTQISEQFYDLEASFNATGVVPGIYHASITATDNGTPVGIATRNFVFEVIYEQAASANEINRPSYKVYPNPTNDLINITISDSDKNFQIELMDLSGQLILSESNKNELNLNHLSNGVYLLKISLEDQVIATERIIKN